MVPRTSRSWILIRGLGRGVGHWATFESRIKSKFPTDRFYFIDLPGNGYMHKIETPTDLTEFTPYMIQQLKKQNYDFKDKAYGLGFSLGAMALVELQNFAPDFFEKIILINTSAANFSSVFDRLRFKAILLAFQLLFIKDLAARELKTLTVTTTLTEAAITEKYKKDLDLIIQYSQNHRSKPSNIWRQLLAASGYQFPIRRNCRVLILSGAQDSFVSPKCSKAIEKNWQCEHEIHPNAGHDICFEDPDWVIENMIDRPNQLDNAQDDHLG